MGDSVGFGIGCLLGDSGGSAVPCPPQPDFTAKNAYQGACSMSPGNVHLYNRTTIEPPRQNCWDFASRWQALVDHHRPKLVVLVTGGWEIVNRWRSLPFGCSPADIYSCAPGADYQWGGADPVFDAAAQNYRQSLLLAINVLGSRGAKVLVLNTPYVAPPEPATPDFPVWWEPYPPSPPSGHQLPNAFTPYASSGLKVDRFNAIQDAIRRFDIEAGGIPGVEFFDFWREFAPPDLLTGDQEYSSTVCPYPDNRNPTITCVLTQVTVRHPAGGHFSPDGIELLGRYLLPKVRQLLGLA